MSTEEVGMSNEMLCESTLAGHILAMAKTGYTKGQEFKTSADATLTLYQDAQDGKLKIIVVWPDGEWVGFQPVVVCMKGRFEEQKLGEWVDKLAEVQEFLNADPPPEDGSLE